ncbi:MAG: CCA tRNA nucleotidyltransferase, partial [Planctomycetes bacterium]|nr:CCA tRNA nucleotidyltransferase [Planctomycetota bacterium]
MESPTDTPDRRFLDPVLQREFAVEIVRRLKEANFTALWAGGCVRDHLLGKMPKDYDVATSATPKQVKKVFAKRKTVDVGASFGVIMVVGPRGAGEVEVATFRSDGSYSDGRRPDSVTFSSPEEDAQRRDFTINGMFFDPLEHKVLDFVGGERDLSQGYIRAIGDPHARMREDKLRMLRAIRFTASLEFGLARTTKAAVTEMAPQIHVVSAERIAAELRRILTDQHRHVAVALANEVGLLREILPEVVLHGQNSADPESESRKPQQVLATSENLSPQLTALRLLQEPSFELAFAMLLRDVSNVEAICRRLKLSNDELERTAWLVRQQDALREPDKLRLAQLKRLLAHPFRDDLLSLMRATLFSERADLHPVLFCEQFLEATPPDVLNPPPLVTGNDLIAVGLKPGPRFKQLLDEACDAQLNGELISHEAAM